MFRLSKRSLNRLQGVDERLVEVVLAAIKVTKVDFGVIEGVRTIERQRELVASGASQTMASKHITGHAVDLAAFVSGRLSWELPLYCDIAEAMKSASMTTGHKIRWGAAWNVPYIDEWEGTMQDAIDFYTATRRSENRRAFIDGPHFELVYKTQLES